MGILSEHDFVGWLRPLRPDPVGDCSGSLAAQVLALARRHPWHRFLLWLGFRARPAQLLFPRGRVLRARLGNAVVLLPVSDEILEDRPVAPFLIERLAEQLASLHLKDEWEWPPTAAEARWLRASRVTASTSAVTEEAS